MGANRTRLCEGWDIGGGAWCSAPAARAHVRPQNLCCSVMSLGSNHCGLMPQCSHNCWELSALRLRASRSQHCFEQKLSSVLKAAVTLILGHSPQ